MIYMYQSDQESKHFSLSKNVFFVFFFFAFVFSVFYFILFAVVIFSDFVNAVFFFLRFTLAASINEIPAPILFCDYLV